MLAPASQVPDRIRKRALSGDSFFDPPTARKPRPAAVAETMRPDETPHAITALRDLPIEIHGEFFAYMAPRCIGQYAAAMGGRLQALGEIDAAALKLRIEEAGTLAALEPLAREFGTIGPAFRDQVVHRMLAVLQDAALTLPAEHIPPLAALLQGCAAAAVGLPPAKAERLRGACLTIALSIGWRFATSGTALLEQMRQMPPLLPAYQGRTLRGAIGAVERLLAETQPHAPLPERLENALVVAIDMAGRLPPRAAEPALRAAFATLDAAERRHDVPPWSEARGALMRAVICYPLETFHRVVSTEEDQFVDTVVDWMQAMPPHGQLEFFDALVAAAPRPPARRLAALTQMASLLSEIPNDAILERMHRLVALGQPLPRDLPHRHILLDELASDATFRALPRDDVPAAMHLLLGAIREGHFARGTAESLFDEMSHRANRAPHDQQDPLWHEVRAARPRR